MATAGWACVPIAGPALAQQRVQETVVVTGAAVPVPFETLSRTVRVIEREEIARLPLGSILDVLRLSAGVDVRARGTHGAQADFSVRGAHFGQTLVLVDGVRLNDAQTGHHNGDWPVTIDQIERVEILLGPGSSLFGADAVGGTINIVTRTAPGETVVSAGGGELGLASGAFGTGFRVGGIAQRVSVSASRASGFEVARDFRTVTAATRTSFGNRTAVSLGLADKAFGANGFYGNSPSREWTRQMAGRVEHRLVAGSAHGLAALAAFRTHRDRFLWDERQPGIFENRHRTSAALVALRGHVALTPRWRLAGGVEQAADWIRSTSLGDHDVSRTGAFAEVQGAAGGRATFAAGLRADRYSTFGTAWNPSVSASLWISSATRVRASVARAFRVPTFTERFYRDPAHRASAELVPERAWSGDLAWDWVPHPQWLATAVVHVRRERDAIDWVKARAQDQWETRNIRSLVTGGVEAGIRRLFGAGARLSVDYAWTDVSAETLPLLSKYVLDYARHGLAVSGSAPLAAGVWVGARLDVRQRTGRDAYALLDVRVSRAMGRVTVHADAANLLDARYQEIRGVNMPGRWLSAGIQWRLP